MPEYVNLSFQPLTEAIPLDFKIVSRLKVQPEEIRRTEVFRKSKSSIGTNASLALYDFVDSSSRDTCVLREPILRYAERAQKFL